jgi:hypothetical protein
MRIDGLGPVAQVFSPASIDDIKYALSTIAKQHDTTVEALLDSARAAGDSAESWQTRALNLEKRIIKLQERT